MDLRLLHHFLVDDIHPHLPVGHDNAWKTELPALAHHREYLMHAILALSASDMSLRTEPGQSSTALSHRQLAITGLNRALSASELASSDIDAMLATCYALTFQSSYIGDGICDFITMLQGCSLLTRLISQSSHHGIIMGTPDWHLKYMESRFCEFPVIDEGIAQCTLQSLTDLESMLEHPAERCLHQLLVDAVAPLQSSSTLAYLNFSKIFGTVALLPRDYIDHIIDSQNTTSQILLLHFVVVQVILTPITVIENVKRVGQYPVGGMLAWADSICQNLRNRQVRSSCISWPSSVVTAIRREGKGEMLLVCNLVDFISNRAETILAL
ncbi:hypothetical protein FQN55_002327 [Onygenales sp. PD_40]|nr:hypothetical protein FQN55_002327 [Onygenales sp. PD_40]KAK2783698.1 hypothetical protein FQN53_009020 [Emmonsiellopsis sp. PD_33]